MVGLKDMTKAKYEVRIGKDITAQYYSWGVLLKDKFDGSVLITDNELAKIFVGAGKKMSNILEFERKKFRKKIKEPTTKTNPFGK